MTCSQNDWVVEAGTDREADCGVPAGHIDSDDKLFMFHIYGRFSRFDTIVIRGFLRHFPVINLFIDWQLKKIVLSNLFLPQ